MWPLSSKFCFGTSLIDKQIKRVRFKILIGWLEDKIDSVNNSKGFNLEEQTLHLVCKHSPAFSRVSNE